MFSTILFPTDGSPQSENATASVLRLAQLHGARLIALSVAQPFPFVPLADGGVVADTAVFENQITAAARRHLDKVAAAAAGAGVACDTILAHSNSPHEEIVTAAEQRQCDLIVMASHGRKGLNKLFLGSETQKVLAHTALPVLILR